MRDDLQPIPATLVAIQPLMPDNHLFTFRPDRPLAIAPGQFLEISIPGIGGFPVSTCDLVRKGDVVTCIRRVGRVTSALFQLPLGARLGLRGPFGNGFPLSSFQGRDALLIAGGLGMAPLRGLLKALLAEADRTERTILLYGSREPGALLFREELEQLATSGRIELRLTVDFAIELPGPAHGVVCRVGLVNQLLDGLALDAAKTTAAVCGPPALYACILEEMVTLGLPPERILATLERRMRCGVGVCCHCVTAGVYLCRDGPVFSLAQLRTMEGAI